MSAVFPDLQAAAKALAANDDREAVRRLVDAWSVVSDLRIAETIARIRPRAAKDAPPLSRTNWFARAARRDPFDLPHLLVTTCKGRSRDAIARLESLARWPRDPLLGETLLSWLEVPPYSSSAMKPFWRHVLDVLDRTDDPRVTTQLARFTSPLDGTLGNFVTREARLLARRKQAQKGDKLDSSDVTVLQAISQVLDDRIARKYEGREAFVAAVRAAPQDDGPRLVYADWLLERDDPLGEFISMQIARREGRGPKCSRDENELIEEYGEAWLGPIAGFVRQCVFERGFPARGALVEAGGLGLDDWATFEHLDVRHCKDAPETLVHFLLQPALRGLRSVTTAADIAMVMLGHKPELPHIELEITGPIDDDLYSLIASRSTRLRGLVVSLLEPARVARLDFDRLTVQNDGFRLFLHGNRLEAEYDHGFDDVLLGMLRHLPRQPSEIRLLEPNVLRPVTKAALRLFPNARLARPAVSGPF